jgi:hypothetical protein
VNRSRTTAWIKTPAGWLIMLGVFGLSYPFWGAELLALGERLGEQPRQIVVVVLCIAWFGLIITTGCLGGYHRNWWLTIGGMLVLFLTPYISRGIARLALRQPPPSSLGMLVIVLPFVLLLASAAHALVAKTRRDRPGVGKCPSGHCLTCGYDLTGNVSGRCPECGAAVPPGYAAGERQ